MREVVSYTDWFVIATGRNTRQTKAIAEEISTLLKQEDGLMPTRAEGRREGDWILLDYLDVVVHVFTPEARAFYRLDRLWGQVPAVEFAAS
jgi:ribosome-associated protein